MILDPKVEPSTQLHSGNQPQLTKDILELLETCCTNDGRSDSWFGHHPRHSDLSHAHTFLVGHFFYTIDDCVRRALVVAVDEPFDR